MNKVERIKLVRAMEYIARNLNDEEIEMGWLQDGVADGDIEYGDLDVHAEDIEEDGLLAYYIEDEHFADLIDTFMWCMAKARRSGGLFCDRVAAGEKDAKPQYI